MSNETVAQVEVPETTVATKKKAGRRETGIRKDREAQLYPLVLIVSNQNNPRDESTSNLIQQGYGVFEAIEGSDKPALVALARGTPEEQKTFVELIEKEDEDTVALYKSIATQGQISPITLIKLEDGNYDIETGCRRFLAMLYGSIRYELPETKISAFDVTDESGDHKVRAAAEIMHRKQMSQVEEARYFNQLKNSGLSIKEVADKTDVPYQTVRHRMMLLNLEGKDFKKVSVSTINSEGKKVVKEMSGPDLLTLVDRGEMPEYRAREIIEQVKKEKKGNATPTDPKVPTPNVTKAVTNPGERRRVPSLKEFQEMYQTKKVEDNWTEQVRKYIAEDILSLDYVDLPTLTKTLRDGEKAKEEAEKAKTEAKAKKS